MVTDYFLKHKWPVVPGLSKTVGHVQWCIDVKPPFGGIGPYN